MSPTFHRGRFFAMAPANIGISSRFNNTPIIMEKSDLLEKDRSEFNRYAILPHIGGGAPQANGFHKRPAQVSIDALYSLLPRDFHDLPSKALDLSAEEDEVLAAEVNRELSMDSPQNLKDAYTEMANSDVSLDGLTDFGNVQRALARNKVVLPPQLLRLVAARCLSTRIPWKVNYERLISFLGSAKRSDHGHNEPQQPIGNGDAGHHFPLSQPRPSNSPQPSVRSDGRGYFMDDDNRPYRSLELPADRPGFTGILRSLKNNPDFRNVDLTSLRSSFQRADSLHRGALSEQQIKDICVYCGLPLDEALATKIIRSCPYKGGGQYDWQAFLHVLERVRPQATGLFIPRSRRPLEMARQHAEASSEWPHGIHAFTSRQNAPHGGSQGSRASSQGGGVGQRPLFREPSPSPRATAPIQQQQRSELYTQHDYSAPDNLYQQQQQQFYQQQQQHFQQQQQQQHFLQQQQQLALDLSQLDNPPLPVHAANSLEARASPGLNLGPAPGFGAADQSSARAPLPPAELANENVMKESWLNRFVRMADALYLADRNKTGFLEIPKAQRLVNDYNSAYMLELPSIEIDKAIQKCTKESSGRVDINAMLRVLGTLKFE